jgi:transposase
MQSYPIEKLADWQGFIAGTVQRFEKGAKSSSPEIWIELWPEQIEMPRCSSCGKECQQVHDWDERWVKDLPAWDAQTHLLVHYRQLKCDCCGVRVEKIDWLEPYARVTSRLAESVARFCDASTIKRAAEFYGLKWDTTKRIHKEYLRRDYPDFDFSDVEIIGMDEFAIKKGHKYATIFVDAENSRVLWVCEGRSEEAITPFFRDILGEKVCGQIRAAVIDMWDAFKNSVNKWCPQAEIVYDLFHIVKNYGKDVIDQVRIDAAAAADKDGRKVIKSSKWLLLMNEATVKRQKEEQQIKLSEVLSANRDIFKSHVLFAELKEIWTYQSEGWAKKAWNSWYWRATHSRVGPLIKFAKNLKERLPGILAHCHYQYNTGLLEGINNKIKVIKRIAYGFRDKEYFFLRILQAFPGNAG